MTAAFPEIVQALYELLPARTVLDGEIVRWADGRLDFTALPHRHTARGARAAGLARAMPCPYIAFDVLRTARRDLTGEPLSSRQVELEQLLADVPGTSSAVALPNERIAVAEGRCPRGQCVECRVVIPVKCWRRCL